MNLWWIKFLQLFCDYYYQILEELHYDPNSPLDAVSVFAVKDYFVSPDDNQICIGILQKMSSPDFLKYLEA